MPEPFPFSVCYTLHPTRHLLPFGNVSTQELYRFGYSARPVQRQGCDTPLAIALSNRHGHGPGHGAGPGPAPDPTMGKGRHRGRSISSGDNDYYQTLIKYLILLPF